MTDFAAPQAILAIVVSRIGDTLLATPALRAIAAAWPDAKLTCLAHPKRAEILRNLPFLHRVGAITKTRAPLLGRFSRRRYDLAFIYGNDRPLVVRHRGAPLTGRLPAPRTRTRACIFPSRSTLLRCVAIRRHPQLMS